MKIDLVLVAIVLLPVVATIAVYALIGVLRHGNTVATAGSVAGSTLTLAGTTVWCPTCRPLATRCTASAGRIPVAVIVACNEASPVRMRVAALCPSNGLG